MDCHNRVRSRHRPTMQVCFRHFTQELGICGSQRKERKRKSGQGNTLLWKWFVAQVHREADMEKDTAGAQRQDRGGETKSRIGWPASDAGPTEAGPPLGVES
eukprot:EG_transcript_50203